MVFNSQKPIPSSASDNERNFVFQCRAYVEAVKPETLKGVAWKTITDKVKEIKPQAAPVVDNGNGAASGAGETNAKPPPAAAPAAAPAASGGAVAPIVSNQAEFNAWFQNSMGKTAGTQRVAT